MRRNELRSPLFVPLGQPLLDELSVDRAIEVLYHRHYAAIRSIVHHRVNNVADADDIAQTVFVKLAVSFDLVYGKDVGKWLSRVAVKQGSTQSAASAWRVSRFSERQRWEVSAESTFLREAEVTRIRAAIDCLPVREKLVVELSYLDGHTHAQIAERSGDCAPCSSRATPCPGSNRSQGLAGRGRE